MNNKLQTILGVLALLGIGIGVGAILVLVFISSGLTPKEISVGPVDFVVPTSQSFTQVAQTQLPTSTTEPQGPRLESLGTIRIFGNSNSGIQIQIPETGIYRFSYRSGAYSTYPVGNSPEGTKTWLTSVLIYRGDKALWDGQRIMDENTFLRLADMDYWDSLESAERAAQGQYIEAPVSQGDILTLIGVDHFNAYADNPGQVLVEWFLITY